MEEIKEKLTAAGLTIISEKDLAGNGTQLKISNGAIVNIYHTGTVQVQGKNAEEVRSILSLQVSAPVVPSTTAKKQAKSEVFVIYGHDEDARTQLEAMLRRWNLKPLILDQLPSEGQTIIEKLEKHTSNADFCVVLATPDDEGYRKGREDEKHFEHDKMLCWN